MLRGWVAGSHRGSTLLNSMWFIIQVRGYEGGGGFQSPCLVLEPAHGGGNGSNVQGAPQRASRLKMRGVCLHAEPQILGAPGLGVVPNAVFCQPVPGKKFSSSASQGSNESASSILASLAIRPGMDLQSDRGTLIAHRWLSTIPPLYSAACPSTF